MCYTKSVIFILMKKVAIVLTVIASAFIIPAVVAAVSDTVTLSSGQVEFIRQFDSATGRNISGLAISTPGAIPIIKSASAACGNVELQKKTILALGGNLSDAYYASNKFENLFCNNNI